MTAAEPTTHPRSFWQESTRPTAPVLIARRVFEDEAQAEVEGWDLEQRHAPETVDLARAVLRAVSHGLSCCGHTFGQHSSAPTGQGDTSRCRCCSGSRQLADALALAVEPS